MGLHPIKLTDDEVRALINRVFHETGFRLDRKDPVIVQYMVQKFLLKDFDEKQRETFSEFTDRIIPALKEETAKMEEQKRRLGDWSRNAAREIVDQSGEEYTCRIREVIRKTDNIMLENLEKHIARLRSEQNDIIVKIQEQRKEFVNAAAEFRKTGFYIFAGCAGGFGFLVSLALYFIEK